MGYRMVRQPDWGSSPGLAAAGVGMLAAFGACLFIGAGTGARARRAAAINLVEADSREPAEVEVWEQ
jgi:hypothetical protein